MRNQQNVKVRVNSSFETICPFLVGYVYMSSNSTSPGSIYGGTWASISGGRYMRAAGDYGSGTYQYVSATRSGDDDVLLNTATTGYTPTTATSAYLPYTFGCYIWRRTA